MQNNLMKIISQQINKNIPESVVSPAPESMK